MRRRLPLRWRVESKPPAHGYADERAESLEIIVQDDEGPLAALALPDAQTAFERRRFEGEPRWSPARYLDHFGMALVQEGVDMSRGESLCFLFTAGDYSWLLLAGRVLPRLEQGPLALSFPELPRTIPWLDHPTLPDGL